MRDEPYYEKKFEDLQEKHAELLRVAETMVGILADIQISAHAEILTKKQDCAFEQRVRDKALNALAAFGEWEK